MRQVSDRGAALFNLSLAIAQMIAQLLGGALKDIGDSKYPDKYLNQAYDENDEEPLMIGGGFAYAADVMTFVCLIAILIYGSIGWLFAPKTEFEKMKDQSLIVEDNYIPRHNSIAENF